MALHWSERLFYGENSSIHDKYSERGLKKRNHFLKSGYAFAYGIIFLTPIINHGNRLLYDSSRKLYFAAISSLIAAKGTTGG